MSTTQPTPKAYRYARFSHSRQAEGMSLERQADVAEEWARQHGVSLDDTHAAYVDPGVSASKGKNLLRGALARILTAVKAGDIKPGSYLLVESVSRFSRLVARLSSKILETLVAAGVRVVFLDTGTEYNQQTIDQLGADVVFRVNASAAAEYARTLKGYKLKAWERARDGMRAGEAATRMLPYWLTCKGVTDAHGKVQRGPIERHPVYTPIVQRIFADYLAGKGKQQIAAALNAGKVPPPQRVGSAKRADFWRPGLIGRTLANRAVIGEFQPCKEIEAPFIGTLEDLAKALTRRRESVGEPIPGYYPALISPETFAQAVAMRERKRVAAGKSSIGSGRPVSVVQHILSGGLARCPVCGKPMQRVNKGARRGGQRQPAYYVCSRTVYGKPGACQRVNVPVADVERALVGAADTLGTLSPIADPALAAELETVRALHTSTAAKVAKLSATADDLMDRVEVTALEPVLAKLAALKSELAALEAQHGKLEAQAAASATNVVKLRVGNMVGALKAYGDTGPLSVNAEACNRYLRECFATVVIDYRTGELACHWLHGPPPAVVKYRAESQAQEGEAHPAAG